MANALSSKLDRLEAAIPSAERPYPRVIRIVANNRDEADELARANGFHPGDDDFEDEIIINRILVSPPGRVHEPIKPYVIGQSAPPGA